MLLFFASVPLFTDRTLFFLCRAFLCNRLQIVFPNSSTNLILIFNTLSCILSLSLMSLTPPPLCSYGWTMLHIFASSWISSLVSSYSLFFFSFFCHSVFVPVFSASQSLPCTSVTVSPCSQCFHFFLLIPLYSTLNDFSNWLSPKSLILQPNCDKIQDFVSLCS